MPKVHITQCLCPQRHCIMAISYIPGETKILMPDGEKTLLTAEDAMEFFRGEVERIIKSGAIDQWCGICKSREFHYEDGETRFTSLIEAESAMRQVETENLRTALFLRSGKN